MEEIRAAGRLNRPDGMRMITTVRGSPDAASAAIDSPSA
jgi:hypothetical protein